MAQSETTKPEERELGGRLREVRKLRGLSLAKVSSDADISTAYLQKLEAGGVSQPSPNMLYRLAQTLDIDYAELMRLAGYVVPGPNDPACRRRNELTHALSSEELTEEEARELTKYLDWYRRREASVSREERSS